MAALLQSFYASFTFYRTIGGQVNQYGFAAPGFTVLPYAVMSALNLMANLVAPHYPTLYLIRTEVMEEAERRTGLSFHYVVGKAVDESGTDNIVMEGWSDIAGSFNDDDQLLYVSPSAEAEEDEKIEICDSSRETIYVPACPRFRRTDDTQTSPLGQFIETGLRRLEFPRYMARRQQAPIQPSLLSLLPLRLRSNVEALLLRLPYSTSYYWRLQQLAFIFSFPMYFEEILVRFFEKHTSPHHPFTVNEMKFISYISHCELFIILMLSNFSGQQSTVAQRAWTVTWLVTGQIFGTVIYVVGRVHNVWRSDALPTSMWLRFAVCCYMVIFGAPAIGGFVVVFQMLKAYGICYNFV